MTKKILTFLKRYVKLITAMVAISGLLLSIYQARTAANSPILRYHIVRISPEINDDGLQSARLKLENSLFQSVNNLREQDASLTYSEALDKVLPIAETVGTLSGGAVIVIQNRGEITAHNLRVNVTLDTPIEEYQIFSNENFSIIDDNRENGSLKFSVDRLTSEDKIQIAILFPGEYAISVIASRADYSGQPTPSTSLLQAIATQTVVASSNHEMGSTFTGFLEFYTESKLDSVQITVFVSSDEVQGEAFKASTNTSKERSLFFNTFQP